MVDGDVDIHVLNKKIKKNLAVKILNKLIKKNDFRGYLFYDFVTRHREGFPTGYYIGLKTIYKNRKWKFDVWLINKPDKGSTDSIDLVKDKLTNKKEIILKLKYLCKKNNLDISSYKIYLAVINKNIKTLHALKKLYHLK